MFYVYILQSEKNNRYYVGSSENTQSRLAQHNSGQVKSTKSHIPWKIVHKESFSSLSEARIREKQIKSWKKRSSIEKLTKHL